MEKILLIVIRHFTLIILLMQSQEVDLLMEQQE